MDDLVSQTAGDGGDDASNGMQPGGYSVTTPATLYATTPIKMVGSQVDEERIANCSLVPSADLDPDLYRYNGEGFYLGYSIENDLEQDALGPCPRPIGVTGERHIFIACETRGGKSERVLVQNLCAHRGSAFVIDCTGQLANVTARRRGNGGAIPPSKTCPSGDYVEGMGQEVCVMDPRGKTNVPDALRGSINPLDYIKGDDPEAIAVARSIAGSYVVKEPGEGGDPYWKQAALEFIAMACFHVATDWRFEGRRTVTTVYRLLMNGDKELYNTIKEACEATGEEMDKNVTPIDLFFQGLKENPLLDDYAARAGEDYLALYAGAREQYEGVRSAAKVALSWADDPQLAASVATSTFTFDRLAEAPNGCTVYLTLNEIKKNVGWFTMLIRLLLIDSRKYDCTATGQQTLIVLDEFSEIPYIEELLEIVNRGAQDFLRLVIVVQDMQQLQTHYPKDWSRFIDAAEAALFFGVTNGQTCDYLSKKIGEMEIVRNTYSLTTAEAKTVAKNEAESITDAIARGESFGRGQNTGYSLGGGESDGESQTRTENGGASHKQSIMGSVLGPLWDNSIISPGQKNRGVSDAFTQQRGRNTNWGINGSESLNYTLQQTRTGSLAWTRGLTETLADTITRGVSQQIFKRPVLEPAKIPEYLARIDGRKVNDPCFPGQALVCFASGKNSIIRLRAYHQDRAFYRCFDPHPKHGFRQAPLPIEQEALIRQRETFVAAELERRFEPVRDRLKQERHIRLISGRDQAITAACDRLLEERDRAAAAPLFFETPPQLHEKLPADEAWFPAFCFPHARDNYRRFEPLRAMARAAITFLHVYYGDDRWLAAEVPCLLAPCDGVLGDVMFETPQRFSLRFTPTADGFLASPPLTAFSKAAIRLRLLDGLPRQDYASTLADAELRIRDEYIALAKARTTELKAMAYATLPVSYQGPHTFDPAVAATLQRLADWANPGRHRFTPSPVKPKHHAYLG